MGALGRRCLTCQPSSRTGENPSYGMIGGTVETSASFEARYAPLSYPTITHASDTEREAHVPGIVRCAASSTFRRHSSTVRAVCVNAPVRICAGGDQRWSSLPRQLSSDELCLVVLYAVSVKLRRDENTTELMPSRPERAEGHGCCRRYRVALSTACRTLLCWCTSCPSNRCL